MEIQTAALIRSRRPRAAGFTLVELMVALVLGGILLAMGVSSFRGAISNNRLSDQSNDLVAAMTLARSQAITTNRAVTFCRADSDAATVCSGSQGDWEFWIVRTATGTIIRRGDVPTYSGAIKVTSDLTDDQIVFASDGLARTNGVLVAGEQIIVCSSHSTTDNQLQVTMDAGSRLSTAHASGGC